MKLLFKTPLRGMIDREMKKAAPDTKGKYVLEIGSGKNSYRHIFEDCRFLATDINKFAGINEVADVTKLKYSDNSFDIVICLNVLEHVYDYNKAVSEMQRVLKKNGKALIAVPFLFPLHDLPNDYWRFSEFTLVRILKGFSSVKITPLVISKFLWRFVLGYFVVAKK